MSTDILRRDFLSNVYTGRQPGQTDRHNRSKRSDDKRNTTLSRERSFARRRESFMLQPSSVYVSTPENLLSKSTSILKGKGEATVVASGRVRLIQSAPNNNQSRLTPRRTDSDEYAMNSSTPVRQKSSLPIRYSNMDEHDTDHVKRSAPPVVIPCEPIRSPQPPDGPLSSNETPSEADSDCYAGEFSRDDTTISMNRAMSPPSRSTRKTNVIGNVRYQRESTVLSTCEAVQITDCTVAALAESSEKAREEFNQNIPVIPSPIIPPHMKTNSDTVSLIRRSDKSQKCKKSPSKFSSSQKVSAAVPYEKLKLAYMKKYGVQTDSPQPSGNMSYSSFMRRAYLGYPSITSQCVLPDNEEDLNSLSSDQLSEYIYRPTESRLATRGTCRPRSEMRLATDFDYVDGDREHDGKPLPMGHDDKRAQSAFLRERVGSASSCRVTPSRLYRSKSADVHKARTKATQPGGRCNTRDTVNESASSVLGNINNGKAMETSSSKPLTVCAREDSEVATSGKVDMRDANDDISYLSVTERASQAGKLKTGIRKDEKGGITVSKTSHNRYQSGFEGYKDSEIVKNLLKHTPSNHSPIKSLNMSRNHKLSHNQGLKGCKKQTEDLRPTLLSKKQIRFYGKDMPSNVIMSSSVSAMENDQSEVVSHAGEDLADYNSHGYISSPRTATLPVSDGNFNKLFSIQRPVEGMKTPLTVNTNGYSAFQHAKFTSRMSQNAAKKGAVKDTRRVRFSTVSSNSD